MNLSYFAFQHILATLLTLLVSCILGGGFGVGIAFLLKLLYKALPHFRRPLIILPWRTILFALVIVLSTSFSALWFHFGPGDFAAQIIPGIGFLLIVQAFTIETALSTWFPGSLAFRLTSLARTLAVSCGVYLAVSGLSLKWGLLNYSQEAVMYMLRPPSIFWGALGIMMGLGFIFDLGLGFLQIFFTKRGLKKESVGQA